MQNTIEDTVKRTYFYNNNSTTVVSLRTGWSIMPGCSLVSCSPDGLTNMQRLYKI